MKKIDFLKVMGSGLFFLVFFSFSANAREGSYFWLECEDCALSGGARSVVDHYGASNRSLVEVKETGERISAELALDGGEYFLWLRSVGDNQGEPRFQIEVNGEEIARGSSNEGLGRIYFWQGPYSFSASGNTQVELTSLSSGRDSFPARWDVILVTDEKDYIPPPGVPSSGRYSGNGKDPDWPVKMPVTAEVHPSLLFTASDIPLIRERIKKEPYRTSWLSIKDYADEALTTDLTQPIVEKYITAGSQMIVSSAFAYLMTEERAYLEKTKEGLLHAFVWINPEHPHRDRWYALSGVLYDCLRAYDMIQPNLTKEEDEKIRSILIDKTEEGYQAILERNRHVTSHNKLARTTGAVGLSALVLSDSSAADAWLKTGMEYLFHCLSITVGPEGIYREGTYYSRYPSQMVLPFLTAYYRRTGVDLYRHPLVEKWLKWNLSVQQPNGLLPAGPDDGHESQFNYSYIPSGALFHWAAAEGWRLSPWRRVGAIDAIILAKEEEVDYEPPAPASAFFSEGQAVFRSDWNDGAIWGFLMNHIGLSHKQLDTSNFIMWAYGKKLLIDAGYGPKGYDGVRYQEGEQHNVMEVNGIFPDRDDSFPMPELRGLKNAMETSFWVYAEGPNALYNRIVAFPHHRYFWIIDELARPGKFKAYWHGLGELTKHSRTQYSWQQEGAGLLAKFLTPAIDTMSTTSPHSHRYGEEAEHSALILSGEGRRTLSVFYPYQDKQAVTIQPLTKRGQWTGGKVRDSEGVGTLLCSESGDDLLRYRGVKTDGDIAFFQEKDEELVYFFVRDAKFWQQDGFTYFASDRPVSLTLSPGENVISGYVSGPKRYFLSFPSPARPTSVTFQGIPWPIRYRTKDKMVDLVIMRGEGEFEVRW